MGGGGGGRGARGRRWVSLKCFDFGALFWLGWEGIVGEEKGFCE